MAVGGKSRDMNARDKPGREDSDGRDCRGAEARSTSRLEHFQEKWNPVFRPEMRPRNKPRVLSVSMETERTLGVPGLGREHAEVDADLLQGALVFRLGVLPEDQFGVGGAM